MKSFDAFGKPIQEFQVKTACGGYLTLCSITVMLVLFITELRYFLEMDTKDQMTIDQNQDQKYMNISISVTFPQVPCSVLYLNLLDPKQANVLHVAHEIYKTRLDAQGQAVGRRIRDSLRNLAVSAYELMEVAENRSAMNYLEMAGMLMSKTPKKVNRSNMMRATHATTHWRCGSCFQSHIDEDDCCFSCEDVREAFRSRGWNDRPRDYIFAQCESEAYELAKPQANEGCSIDARLLVRKVPGTLHIGVGRFFTGEFLVGQERKSLVQHMNFDHVIHNLSFGPHFPGLVKVLDGRRKTNHAHPNTEHYQYDVHVIPTRYQEDRGEEIISHQYSVTEHVKPIDASERRDELFAPGLWASYDFTPFEVKVTKTRKVLLHFLTECCAILGGIFAFTGMLDTFSYRINRELAQRFRKGGTMQLAEVPSKD
mmetsp:Transcript_51663/g.122978  ORF Transcript_51663/g.122978 Transcript_51663/m.122978 type:complete len:426 (-) Transcript_51663:34-1311(-)